MLNLRIVRDLTMSSHFSLLSLCYADFLHVARIDRTATTSTSASVHVVRNGQFPFREPSVISVVLFSLCLGLGIRRDCLPLTPRTGIGPAITCQPWLISVVKAKTTYPLTSTMWLLPMGIGNSLGNRVIITLSLA